MEDSMIELPTKVLKGRSAPFSPKQLSLMIPSNINSSQKKGNHFIDYSSASSSKKMLIGLPCNDNYNYNINISNPSVNVESCIPSDTYLNKSNSGTISNSFHKNLPSVNYGKKIETRLGLLVNNVHKIKSQQKLDNLPPEKDLVAKPPPKSSKRKRH